MGAAVAGDRFELVRSIGAGGMGVVYEALDRTSGARVALKTLQHGGGLSLYQLKREFRALADVTHPNLVRLYELVVEDDGSCVFTMELVEQAVDLMRWLRSAPTRRSLTRSGAVTRAPSRRREGPTTSGGETETRSVADEAGPRESLATLPSIAVDLVGLRAAFRQLAEGVDAIHRAGKLHRDLKPSNVLVRPDGRVTILDFGLAADLAEAPEPQHGGATERAGARTYDSTDQSISGTAFYMSPEQAEARPLGPASDWYAVGVMLYEALVGELPIDGDPLFVILRKPAADAERPSDRAAGIPPDLDGLCHALLSREADGRPDADAILAVLGGSRKDAEGDGLASLPFVGRDEALTTLEEAFAAARERPVVQRVRGVSGVGKSTLVARFLAGHVSDAWICEGRCFEQETVPFKALDGVVDALVRIVSRMPEAERAARMPPEIGALARMFPSVERISGETAHGSPEEIRARALTALAGLLTQLGRDRAVIVYIDDLQWGDEGGVRLLGELLAKGVPLLLLVGSRAEYEDRSAGLRALEDVQRSLPAHVRRAPLDLARLEDEAASTLALALSPTLTPERVAWVVREAEGNPFFLQELARGAAARSPDAPGGVRLDELLRGRVAMLPDEPRAILEACALAARPLPLRAAVKAAGLGTIAPSSPIELRRERLVRSTGPGLDDEVETFHDRVREAVAAGLSPERRRTLHAALAATLSELPGVEPETIAAHHEAAGERDLARVSYLRAAEAAARALAFERTELFLSRALGLAEGASERADVREQRVHFLTNLGRFADAYAEGREALAEVGVETPAAFSPPALLSSLGRVAWRARGRDAAMLASLPEASSEPTRLAVRLLAAVMKAAYQVRPELCVTLANESVALCLRDGNTPDCAIGYMVHGAIFRGGVVGQLDTGYAYGRLALDLVERYATEAQRAEVSFVVGYFATSWRRPAEEAEELFLRAVEAGLRIGDDFHVGCAAAGLAMSRVMRGAPHALVIDEGEQHLAILRARRLAETASTLDSAVALARRLRDGDPIPLGHDDATLAAYGSRHFAHFQLLSRAIAAWHDGDEARARVLLKRAEPFLPDARGMLHSAEHVFWRALSARPGDPRIALDAARLTRWASGQPQNFGAKAMLARALSPGARRDRSRFERAADHARASGRPHLASLALELASRRGR